MRELFDLPLSAAAAADISEEDVEIEVEFEGESEEEEGEEVELLEEVLESETMFATPIVGSDGVMAPFERKSLSWLIFVSQNAFCLASLQ